MISLRRYQREATRAILDALANSQRRQLVVLPTGTGKTVVFVQLAAQAKRPVLVVAHRDELLDQAAAKAVAAGIDPAAIGKIKAERNEWDKQFVVASIQSLYRRLKPIPPDRYGLVVADEAHHMLARTYRRVIDHFAPTLLLGVTATPDRGDGKGLAEIFGPEPVFSYPLIKAVADGWLVRPRQWAIATGAGLDGVHTRHGDFALNELADAVNTFERNRRVAQAWHERANGRPTVVFTVDVQHAHDLARAFNDTGARAAAIHGKTPTNERKDQLERLETGRIDVLCNCALLTEGWDCPPVSCIVMARPTQSRALYAQCIGRGLRPHGGKAECIILDITDNCRRHRLVTVGDLLGVEQQDCDGADVLKVAEDEERAAAEQRERRANLAARTEEIDPFAPVALDGYRPSEHWHGNPPTPKQLVLLRKFGIDLDVRTAGEASYLIDREIDRRNSLPVTPKQVAFLRLHRIDSTTLNRREASIMIGRIKRSEPQGAVA